MSHIRCRTIMLEVEMELWKGKSEALEKKINML